MRVNAYITCKHFTETSRLDVGPEAVLLCEAVHHLEGLLQAPAAHGERTVSAPVPHGRMASVARVFGGAKLVSLTGAARVARRRSERFLTPSPPKKVCVCVSQKKVCMCIYVCVYIDSKPMLLICLVWWARSCVEWQNGISKIEGRAFKPYKEAWQLKTHICLETPFK